MTIQVMGHNCNGLGRTSSTFGIIEMDLAIAKASKIDDDARLEKCTCASRAINWSVS